MKRILYLLLTFILVLFPAWAQNPSPSTANSDLQELAGNYIYSSGFVGAEFVLSGDGKYRYNTFSDCCDPVWMESGSYALQDNVLHFKATEKTLQEYRRKYNLLDPEQAVIAVQTIYHRSISANDTRTEYDMQLIRWGERLYLVAPDKLNVFTAAVNSGVEPRRSTIDRNYLAEGFFLRIRDMDKATRENLELSGQSSSAIHEKQIGAANGNPVLPEPWNSYLQAAPIKATVTKIESQSERNTYQINKGSADGVKVGMTFVGENQEIDLDNLLFVISVEEDSAIVKSSAIFRAPNYQPGDILVTKKVKNPQ